MIASSATTAGDSRPTAFDKNHPTSGDCGGCHTTTPTFSSDVTSSAKPANHIPTTAACAQCHTTAGNYALYSVTGTHQGVTNCLSCHGPSVATTFANITITTLSSSHIPIGALDCNGSGCHTTTNVSSGGFHIGAANINSPTLTTAGHTTIAAAVPACQTCHETAPYQGMIASTATSGGRLETDGVRQESPDDRRLRRLPHINADVRSERHQRQQTCQSHSDQRALRPVSHDGRQLRCLRNGRDRTHGHYQRVRTVSRQRAVVREHGPADTRGAADGSDRTHPRGQYRLRAMPFGDQLHDLRRNSDETRAGARQRLRQLPRARHDMENEHRGTTLGTAERQPPRGAGLWRLRVSHLQRQACGPAASR